MEKRETVTLGHWGTGIAPLRVPYYKQSNSAPRGTVSVHFSPLQVSNFWNLHVNYWVSVSLEGGAIFPKHDYRITEKNWLHPPKRHRSPGCKETSCMHGSTFFLSEQYTTEANEQAYTRRALDGIFFAWHRNETISVPCKKKSCPMVPRVARTNPAWDQSGLAIWGVCSMSAWRSLDHLLVGLSGV